jgi:hypothetical protein
VTIVSAEIAVAKVQKYMTNDIFSPYFIVIDDRDEYHNVVGRLSTLSQMRVSDFCATDDSYPNIDALCEALAAMTRNTFLLGLGEYMSLSGNTNAVGIIKDLRTTAKIVIVCRNIRSVINHICNDDKKFNDRRVCFLKSGDSYEITKFPFALTEYATVEGFKALLSQLERGKDGVFFVKSSLPLQNVKEIRSAYEAIRQKKTLFSLPQTCLPDSLWTEYLADENIDGYDLFHWRRFLKLKLESASDIYLRLVIEKSADYGSYGKRVFSALLEVPINDKRFTELYAVRKKLLEGVKDNDIAEYVAETKIKDNDRIYYLTDNTISERQAIIESLNGMASIPDAIKGIYPALYAYLNDYTFDGEKGTLLTDYFAEYKRLKLTNRLTPEFHERVRCFAVEGNRPYTSLDTRGYVLDHIDTANAALYWIDALGAEYIGYIQSRAHSLKLKIDVHVARANLPTITSLNRDFYDTWSGVKEQSKELDNIKHEGEHDFNYQTEKTPKHLATELRIIDEVLDHAKKCLAGKNADKVVVVSDHGASRLAVINEHECTWEMAAKGEHSGRCCLGSEADVKSEYAILENGFWVLANYDRFKGGRKASVEVHGGATLEEIVVPLIEIELLDNKIEIINTTPVTTASFKKPAEIVLFSKSKLKKVSVKVSGYQYFAEKISGNKHKILFTEGLRSGKYSADAYEGDNLIGSIEFEVQHESGKSNDSDWFH